MHVVGTMDRRLFLKLRGTFPARGGPFVGRSSPGCLRGRLLATEFELRIERRLALMDRWVRRLRLGMLGLGLCDGRPGQLPRLEMRQGGHLGARGNVDHRDRQRSRLRVRIRLLRTRRLSGKQERRLGPWDKLGIRDSKMRRGVNGGLIIEILGPENVAKADALAKKLREALKEEARVSRPTIMGELQCWNMDDTVDSEEVKNVISVAGDCDPAEVRTGVIRRMHSGLNSVWIKCPLAAAIKVAATGRVCIGWTSARVRLLEPRPVQCFKCWRFGHVRNTCRFPEDRTGNCFRCGSRDHVIRDCRASPQCAICSQSGRGANHRLGSLPICNEPGPAGPVRGMEHPAEYMEV